jgi:uroporphyrin-III C-methyltransferase
MPDQRVVCSTLKNMGNAMDSAGEQRPPGMIVVGWSVLSLWGDGDMKILDEDAADHDGPRVRRWLDEQPWRIQEGVDDKWEQM